MDTKSAKTKKVQLKKVPKKTEVIYPDQLNIVYSNFSSFMFSSRDLTIDFGVRQPQKVKPSEEPPVLIHTRVIMSPIEAKVFSDTLSNLVKQVEKEMGKLVSSSPKK